MLTSEEINRYKRHLSLPGFGPENQEKLKAASVLVIGAGGLGSPVLQYLAAAGIGTIGIIDHDRVDLSNLQRQVIYSTQDVGRYKAEAAAEKIRMLNPNVTVTVYKEKISTANALSIIPCYDVVVDGTDNFATRYLISDACVLSGKPCVSGSVFRFEGQVVVLNALQNDGSRGPDYRQLFPLSSQKENNIDCNTAGVMGVLPGIIGTMQAAEVIKLITGNGEILNGELLLVNSLSLQFLRIKLPSDIHSGKGPQTPQEFLNWDYGSSSCEVNELITATELSQLISGNTECVVIDVRMPMEFPEAEGLNALNIPLPLLNQQSHTIPEAETIVVFCKSGQRSQKALEILKNQFPKKNIFSLKGGVEEWLRVLEEETAR